MRRVVVSCHIFMLSRFLRYDVSKRNRARKERVANWFAEVLVIMRKLRILFLLS